MICKKELVIDATLEDVESIVGEECHIISARKNGPRYDASFEPEKLDSYENLMLLCRTDHKMVDDQAAAFTVEILRQMKASHEDWVSQRLAEDKKPQPLRYRRVNENIPDFLQRLSTGKEVLDIVSNAMAYAFEHDELSSQEEVDIVGGFLQTAQDWGDLSDELEAGGRVQTAYDLTQELRELEEAGFFVFGGREVQLLEGGVQPCPSNWPVAILRVLRKENKEVICFDFNELIKERTTK
jgi:hypothetical protein